MRIEGRRARTVQIWATAERHWWTTSLFHIQLGDRVVNTDRGRLTSPASTVHGPRSGLPGLRLRRRAFDRDLGLVTSDPRNQLPFLLQETFS
jgi:hypothetical protein